jgi:hypothetical protein
MRRGGIAQKWIPFGERRFSARKAHITKGLQLQCRRDRHTSKLVHRPSCLSTSRAL